MDMRIHEGSKVQGMMGHEKGHTSLLSSVSKTVLISVIVKEVH
jgi:hypothetical protein